MRLRNDEYQCLVMALIRYKAYHDGEVLTEAWTGLGTKTEFKQALEAGYMQPLGTAPILRTTNWWKLAEKGAAIVQQWIDKGYGQGSQPYFELSRSQFKLKDLPPQEVEV